MAWESSSAASECILCVWTSQHPEPWRRAIPATALLVPHCSQALTQLQFQSTGRNRLWWVVTWRVGDLQSFPKQTPIALLLLHMWRTSLNYTVVTLTSVHIHHSQRWGTTPRTQEYRLQRCPHAALLNPCAQLQHAGWWEHLFFSALCPSCSAVNFFYMCSSI